MISFFPKPYEDEALYSIIARYHQQSGNAIARETLLDLFDSKKVHSSVVLPMNLGAMAKKTAPFGLDFDSLLSKTLFPYYTVFAQQNTFDKIYKWTRNNEPGSIYALLGLFGGGVQQPEMLRFCPECFLEEQKEHGEGYWHLLHQTPGVLVCEKHFCKLLNSKVPYLSRGSNQYTPAKLNQLFPSFISEPFSPENHQLAVQLVLDTKWLYSNIELVRNTFSKYEYTFQHLYIHLLKEKGLATVHGILRPEMYITAFIDFYGKSFLDLLGLGFAAEVRRPWILSMCRTSKTTTFPLKYILLSRFLCGSLKNLINIAVTRKEAIRHRKRYIYTNVANIEIKKAHYREKWLDAWKSIPAGRQNDIRNLVPSVYTWLNRHDAVWLQENAPIKRKRGGNKIYADWNKRDKLYATQIRSASDKIRKLPGKPVKITITKIGQQLGCGKLFLSKRHYLPLTTRELEKCVEDNHSFRIRRISWAIDELKKQEKPVVMWRVMKLAGVRDDLWREYWDLVISQSIRIEA